MSFTLDSALKKIKDLERTVAQIQDNLIFTPPTNDLAAVFGNLGARNASHGIQTGRQVTQPITHLLTDVDDGGSSTGVFNRLDLLGSNVLVDRSGFTTLELKHIQKTANNGQTIMALAVKSGKILTLKPGGNLDIQGEIVITERDLAYLVYSEDRSNKYRVLLNTVQPGLTILYNEFEPEVTFTELSPGKKILAKWKITGFDPALAFASGAIIGIAFLMAQFKHGTATGRTNYEIDQSDDNVNYNFTVSGAFQIINNTQNDFIFHSEVAIIGTGDVTLSDTMYIRLFGQRLDGVAGTSRVRKLKVAIQFLLSHGLKVEKITPDQNKPISTRGVIVTGDLSLFIDNRGVV